LSDEEVARSTNPSYALEERLTDPIAMTGIRMKRRMAVWEVMSRLATPIARISGPVASRV
jgi:hypothetical protein